MNTFLMNAIFYLVWSLINLMINQQQASTSIRHLEENESFHNVDFQLQDLGLLNDVEIQNLETFQNNFLSPEQVIGYPKAPRRKKDTREKKNVA